MSLVVDSRNCCLYTAHSGLVDSKFSSDCMRGVRFIHANLTPNANEYQQFVSVHVVLKSTGFKPL
jgi:hypothetical protein